MDRRRTKLLSKIRRGTDWSVTDLEHVTKLHRDEINQFLEQFEREGLVAHEDGKGWNACEPPPDPSEPGYCLLMNRKCPLEKDNPDCSQECPIADTAPHCVGSYGGTALGTPVRSFERAARSPQSNNADLNLTEDDPSWISLCCHCDWQDECHDLTKLRQLGRIAGTLEFGAIKNLGLI